eukprot:6176842-Pleurochrysis_carterae.AAC.3
MPCKPARVAATVFDGVMSLILKHGMEMKACNLLVPNRLPFHIDMQRDGARSDGSRVRSFGRAMQLQVRSARERQRGTLASASCQTALCVHACAMAASPRLRGANTRCVGSARGPSCQNDKYLILGLE